MFRSTRPLLSSTQRLAFAASQAPRVSQMREPLAMSFSRPILPSQQAALPGRVLLLLRSKYSTKPPLQPTSKKLEAHPESVTAESTTRPLFEPSQAPPQKDDDVLKGLKGDLHTFKETFDLKSVPSESYALGLAGTLPYLATSLSNVYLCWDLNTQWPSESQFLNTIMVSHDTAAHYLQLIEPVQAGYGAVIISFLGAIHWGLEYAEKTKVHERTRFRYAMGVVAPAVAWPTMLMPIEWALTSQFLAFTMLYFADSRATSRGWTPQWYGTYRWVLTAIVGVSIFISLVGRAKVGEARPRLTSADLENTLGKNASAEQPYHNWARLEEEEKARIKKEKEEEEKKKKAEEKKKKEAEKKLEKEKGKNKAKEGGAKKDDKSEDAKKENNNNDKEEDDSEQSKDKGGKD
ncbi:hypothetical protein QBC46DRAFT_319807 [Diplogelasinospora grovesii]|uniref:Mitochondrial inner membrane protein 1 n=1 Tax=Diplogelasinospora grovesii TaxID=303347 RepID=A0AAN6N4Q7_9PEZI|nr:hypothetical protein QBC46DRAFT_319807 [Diplogelasinospora grovesii]